jgi:ribonuclease HII
MTGSNAVTARVPTLRHERALLRAGHRLVAGMDEVGRGALAGPVTVGVVVVHASLRSAPSGVRDSKLLTPAARQALVPRLRRWAPAHAVGHAEPDEIDRYGIIAALRLAGRRALAELPEPPDCVLLDGSHDWLTQPSPSQALGQGATQAATQGEGLAAEPPAVREPAPVVPLVRDPTVLTLVKADLRCAAVAAASVLAKVERDSIMVVRSRDHPEYCWQDNKGYSAPEHAAALRAHGPCGQHRRTWSLPGLLEAQLPLDLAGLDLADLELADLDLADLDLADLDPAAVHLGRLAADPVARRAGRR